MSAPKIEKVKSDMRKLALKDTEKLEKSMQIVLSAMEVNSRVAADVNRIQRLDATSTKQYIQKLESILKKAMRSDNEKFLFEMAKYIGRAEMYFTFNKLVSKKGTRRIGHHKAAPHSHEHEADYTYYDNVKIGAGK